VAAAELQDCFSKITDCFGVFRPEAFYRRKGIIRGGPGWSHHQGPRVGGEGHATLW
jgi:hypothetical protein